MRAALYHRVSTVDQNAAAARRELRTAAKRFGARVVLDVEETGSGAANDRPGLRRVLEAARRREIDAVLVWKLDRWGRSSLDLLANLRELETCGVRFIATTQGIDLKPGGDAISRMLVGFLAAVAEFERDLIRERTRLGMQQARERGVRLGRPRRPLPDVEVVESLDASGESLRAVAGALGCSTHSIRQVLAGDGERRDT